MIKSLKRKFFRKDKLVQEPDYLFLILAGALSIIGLISLASASAVESYNRGQTTSLFFYRQLAWFAIALVVFFISSRLDYHVWKKFGSFALFFTIAILLTVFIPGLRAGHGTSNSWISIFGLSVQPSEFAKLSFLIYLSSWLESKRSGLKQFSSGMAPFAISLTVVIVLVLLQPDLGTLIILVLAALTAFFIAGGNVWHILLASFLAVLVLSSSLLFRGSDDYQSARIACYLNPSFDEGRCHQINQSLIAVGSGSWFGRGLGLSRQKYSYLPEVWADSIFPIIAEEFGFIFSSIILILFALFFYQGFQIAKRAPDFFGSILVVSIIAWLFFQSFFNIAGMINLIPMTGVPLPFISAGGSHLIAIFAALGIITNISRQVKYGNY